jgi:hypothetical protein
MTNRERVTAAIEQHATQRLRDELDYFMDGDREYDYDMADALSDVLDYAEREKDRAMARTAIDVLIAAGYYQPRAGGDDGWTTTGRDRSPVRGGVRYDCVAAWAAWIDE